MTNMTTLPGRTRGRVSTIPGALAAAIGGFSALAGANICFAILTSDGHAENTSDYLALVGDNAGLVEFGSALGLLACVLIVPAVWAVVGVLSDERPQLSSIGGWLMSSGYIMGVALSVESLVAVSVAGSSENPSAYIDAVDNGMTIAAVGMYAVFGLGALVGGFVLGVAMLRHSAMPRWCAIALMASEPVRVIGLLSGFDYLTAVASLLLLMSFVGALSDPGSRRRIP